MSISFGRKTSSNLNNGPGCANTYNIRLYPDFAYTAKG